MEVVFLLFGIISVLLIIDGQALRKQERIRPLLKHFNAGNNVKKTRFISAVMQIAGGLTLLWTIIGFFLYDLLILPIFIVVYLLVLGVVAGTGLVVWQKKS